MSDYLAAGGGVVVPHPLPSDIVPGIRSPARWVRNGRFRDVMPILKSAATFCRETGTFRVGGKKVHECSGETVSIVGGVQVSRIPGKDFLCPGDRI